MSTVACKLCSCAGHTAFCLRLSLSCSCGSTCCRWSQLWGYCTGSHLVCLPASRELQPVTVSEKLPLLLQNGLAERVQKSRKQIKERKNRTKKIRGTKKNAGAWNSRVFRACCWVVFAAAARLAAQ